MHHFKVFCFKFSVINPTSFTHFILWSTRSAPGDLQTSRIIKHLICLVCTNLDWLFVSLLHRWAERRFAWSLGKQTIRWCCERRVWRCRPERKRSNRALWGWRWQRIQGGDQDYHTWRRSLSVALEWSAKDALFARETCENSLVSVNRNKCKQRHIEVIDAWTMLHNYTWAELMMENNKRALDSGSE